MNARPPAVLTGIALLAAACTAIGDPQSDSATTAATDGDATTSSTTVTLPPEDLTERAIVDGVIDGDSFRVTLDGMSVEVRLLGVNAPEIGECHADRSRGVLADLIGGAVVVLVAGPEDADYDDRLLRYAYVETDTEPLFVNAELLREGAALGMQTDHGLVGEFKEIEERAYASGRGMWATFACGQPEGGAPDRPQLRVSDISHDPEGEDGLSLSNEWVDLANESYTAIDVDGWTIRDESSLHRLTIPGPVQIAAGGTLRVVSGCGTATVGTVFWCSDGPVWSNGGDTVIVQDDLGNVVERLVYRAG